MTAPDTYTIDGCDTLPKLFRKRVAGWGDKVAMRTKRLGIWRSVTWREYGAQARRIGLGLLALGLRRGETVSILSENSQEWLFIDQGVLGVGGVTSGVYTTDSAKQLAYLINDSGSAYLFVENEEQLDKFLAVKDQVPSLRKVFVIDRKGLRDFDDPMVMSLAALGDLGEVHDRAHPGAWDAGIDAAHPDDTMILIYTSGTTGPPKGAMISHRNAIAQIHLASQCYPMREDDEQLSFLPLCHIAERSFSILWPLRTGAIINFVEGPDTVAENIREVAPTVLFAVPRIWEKFFSAVTIGLKNATPFGRWAYERAIAVGYRAAVAKLDNRRPSPALRLLAGIAEALVLTNIRRMLGLNRIRYMVTGAAPISPDLIRWFTALGLTMYELYGQTECTGVCTTNRAGGIKLGSIGRAIPGMEVALSPAGEILTKGPLVFQGYLNQPEKTAETITEGWLHTGDVGTVDERGFFRITDRMKDIIITAGGKNITPSEIENQLKFSPYISDAVVIGDKRKFLTCLVMIDHENVVKFAQDHDVPFTNYASLCRAKPVLDLIGSEIDKVNANFAQVETIKRFRLIEQLLTAEDDELTPTMKLKRKFVNQKYQQLIESMYAE